MIFLAIALVIFVIGYFVKVKKITWLISGYNTASKEKQAEYDIDKLTRYFGNLLYILAGTYAFWGIAQLLFPEYMDFIIWGGFGTSLVVLIGGIIYLNTGDRIKKKQ